MYIVLIHWKAEEAAPRRAGLVSAGYTVDVLAPAGSAGLKVITPDVDAVLIDLGRLPMQGRAVGVELRKRAATRSIPLVFVGGTPEKVAATRALLPDAVYLEWDDLPAGLETAVLRPPRTPVVPDTMAGYSGSSLTKKLGIKASSVLALMGAPDGFTKLLDPLPEGVRIVSKAAGAERAMLFIRAMKDLEQHWTKASAVEGTLWVAWPKKASGIRTDVTENTIRAFAIERGWVDYKVCAIDGTWSGFALARRKAKAAG